MEFSLTYHTDTAFSGKKKHCGETDNTFQKLLHLLL